MSTVIGSLGKARKAAQSQRCRSPVSLPQPQSGHEPGDQQPHGQERLA